MSDFLRLGKLDMRIRTEEEKKNDASSRITGEVAFFALYALAEVSCSEIQKLCNAILEPRSTRIAFRPIEVYKEKRIIDCANRIKRIIGKFYQMHLDYMSTLQLISGADIFESVACVNDYIREHTKKPLEKLYREIDTTMSECRPLDNPLFSHVNRCLYLDSLFVNYRVTFKNDLGDKGLEVFRQLKVSEPLRDLANLLKIQDKDGREISYLWNGAQVNLWKSLEHRRSYHGREIAKTHPINVRMLYNAESSDRACFEVLKVLFKLSNIDKYLRFADVDSPRYSEMFSTTYFFGSMDTYEQYRATAQMISGQIANALESFRSLHQKFPDNEMIVAYQHTNRNMSEFYGTFTSVEEAARECGVSVETVRENVEYHKTFKSGVQRLMYDPAKRSFFHMELLEQYIIDKLNKKNYGKEMR